MQYTKSALTLDDQLRLVQQRGLVVSDASRAQLWLRKISYFRLSAYFLPFKDGEQFRPGVDFNDVAGLYIFDRKLRLLAMDAIERAEVAIRTAVTNEIAHAYGPFGHTNPTNFAPSYDHARFMIELATEEQRTREVFVGHFRQKYTSEPHLPVWMATELLSFGAVSKLYRALAPGLKGNIAAPFRVQDRILASWLHALSHVRNICAHHGQALESRVRGEADVAVQKPGVAAPDSEPGPRLLHACHPAAHASGRRAELQLARQAI